MSENQLSPHLIPLDHESGRAIIAIAQDVAAAGGRALVVGGAVRDALLGAVSKDLDLEVFGVPADQLEALLAAKYRIDQVGRSFGVFIVKGLGIDVALPRRERKSGQGHKAFTVEGDPEMTFAEAAARRDFTLNAISWDPLNGEIIDPAHGQRDLAEGVLRHVSHQFAEDPLRVLRAMQFLARFELTIAPETLALCQSIEAEDLPRERLFEEWSKLILKGKKPSVGLHFLRDCGWIRYYPELLALPDCPQDPQWHPEGNVWLHTLHCMDAFARERIGDDWEDLVVGFAVLLHDIGKPATTFTDENGRVRSPAHDVVGLPIAETFLRRLTAHRELIDQVLPLIETHMRPADFYKNNASHAAIRRLANRVGRIDRLLRVATADMAGRPPKAADFPAGEWLRQKAEELAVQDSVPRPLVQGRDLIELGLKPGKSFKAILDTCFEAQLDGEFATLEDGITFARKVIAGEN
ncbi:CCA tRNA nucleotidyltransferase [Cerasicoccus arenae]|uniref:Multifunctional CCA protein n=1 Tax=Cerasicoccus arenae TaxID=424488 RepID=A0A8J3D9G8_9BACT|nr:HD domain-containing protein [Cerasicoccus arenae]MBK1857691.1 HD domain-containing protein [Cerasicoccus arenae]GHB91342.1 multifunctional CCA protein [Cerasicoccus arenae]